MKNIFILLIIFYLGSCRHMLVTKSTPEEPDKAETLPIDEPIVDFSNLKIALVLAGLDAKGFANVGVLQALEKHEIFPSNLVATGMGGLTAAIYSNDSNSFSLEWKHFKLKRNIYFDFSIIPGRTIEPKRLINFINENVSARKFSKLSVPLTIVTSNIQSGETVVHKSGNLADALYSGIAIPGLFSPLKSRRQTLFSGFLTEGLPISVALTQEVDAIIAVDLEYYNRQNEIKSSNEIFKNSIKAAGKSHLKHHANNEKVFIIRPDLGSIDSMSFSDIKYIISIGFKEVDKISEDLKIFLSEIKRNKNRH